MSRHGNAPVGDAVVGAATGPDLPSAERVQQAVDRRFDRRRYDAARTIERFSARLRQEVDLDMLSGELLRVVDHTMQPTMVWLWLRPRAGPSYLGRMRTG
jgi:hypothetical protein